MLNSRRRVTCCALENLELTKSTTGPLRNHLVATATTNSSTEEASTTTHMAVPSLASLLLFLMSRAFNLSHARIKPYQHGTLFPLEHNPPIYMTIRRSRTSGGKLRASSRQHRKLLLTRRKMIIPQTLPRPRHSLTPRSQSHRCTNPAQISNTGSTLAGRHAELHIPPRNVSPDALRMGVVPWLWRCPRVTDRQSGLAPPFSVALCLSLRDTSSPGSGNCNFLPCPSIYACFRFRTLFPA